MWFRKKATEKAPIFLGCVGCGCLMLVARKEVGVTRTSGSPFDASSTFGIGSTYAIYTSPEDTTEFFCGRCAPPYDMKRLTAGNARYYRTEPSRNIEVTEKGKKLGGE